MSQSSESNSQTQQTHSGRENNASRNKNVNSYYAEIGGDFKGVQGDNSGVINQYIITQKSGLEITSQPLIKGSPYLGLRKFEVDDKDKFFGRDRWIIELTNYLEKENVLLLLGASGSGKSSLIQAGLIPKLKDNWGSSQLVNLTFVPDKNPFKSFCYCLAHKYGQSQAELALNGKEDTLLQVVQTLKNDAQWLIFIDQFEEVFTRTDKTKPDIFIKSLIKLIENSDSSVKVIMTMRADFLDKLSPYPDLGKVHDSSSRMLTDMEDSDLRLAIAEPAARNGVIFEKGLVDTIIADFKQQAGSLPLLQYTLNLLWSKDDITDRVLNTKTYQELGGVTGALQQQADDIYYNSKNKNEKLNGLERKAAEQIFLELISLKDKEPVSRRADKSIFCDDDIRESALEKLINNRLLVVSKGEEGKATVEVAHEALLRSWKVLQDLILDKKEIIVLKDRLYDDAKQWDEVRKQDAEKANSELWDGHKLARIVELRKEQALPNLDTVGIEFIDASLAEIDREDKEKKEQIQRELERAKELAKEKSQSLEKQAKFTITLTFLLTITLGAGIFGWIQQNNVNFANERRQEELIQSAWISLKPLKTKPLNKKDQERYDNQKYKECGTWLDSGLRDLYCQIKPFVDYSKLRIISGLPIFVNKLPHTDSSLNFEGGKKFGYYNPKFLKWINEKALNPSDGEFKNQIQLAYNDRIRVVARAFYQSHKILFATPEEFEAFKKKYEVVQKKYQELLRTRKTNEERFVQAPLKFKVIKSKYLKLLNDKSESVPSNKLSYELQEDFRSLADYLATQNENASKNAFKREEKENYWYLANVSGGFWVRRSIDGTEKQFFDILTKLLEIYDAEWLNEQKLLDTQPSQ